MKKILVLGESPGHGGGEEAGPRRRCRGNHLCCQAQGRKAEQLQEIFPGGKRRWCWMQKGQETAL